MVAKLPDPETCRACGIEGQVIESRRSNHGYRRRRHECPCCGRRWTSYQTILNPNRMTFRKTPNDEPHTI